VIVLKERTIELKTSIDIARIRRTGRAVYQVLRTLRHSIRPGVTTAELAAEVGSLLERLSVRGALRGYRGYPDHACVSVNHVAVHGVPGDYTLEDGDILTVDLTAEKDGWYADAAWTYTVGPGSPDARRLVRATWAASIAGIRAAVAGARFGDVGEAIEAVAARYGCTVLDRFVGHGIGRSIHEDPIVLHTGECGTGAPIVPGMVFTIEPILSLGGSEVFPLDDGWSMVSNDHSLCAQFEHTVAVFGSRTEILTWNGEPEELDGDYPPYT
jgi:methionyl aminopeptidase